MKFLFSLFFISLSSFADTYNPCLAKHNILELSKIGLQDCKLANALVNNPDIKTYHRRNIYQKLARKLAIQLEQNMEEMALIDQFYSSNNSEILQEDETNCKLDKIMKSAKCSGASEKLSFLQSNLKSPGNTFLEKLTNKYASTRNIGVKNRARLCPLEGASANFILKSQIDNIGAMKIINTFGSKKDDANILSSEFPLLKLLDKSNDDTKLAFKNYLLHFTGTPDQAQKYVTDFFTDQKNIKSLSAGLEGQCSLINLNVQKFLCQDLNINQLSSSDPKVSPELFGGLLPNTNFEDIFSPPPADTIEGELFFTAYGLQCSEKTPTPLKEAQQANSVDGWYSAFIANTHPESTAGDSNISGDNFCQLYTCSPTTPITANQCPNKKPPTAKDMIAQYQCPDGKACTPEISKFIAYLSKLDKENDDRASILAKSSQKGAGQSSTQASTTATEHYSTFTSKFLGDEGMLIIGGKTPLSSTSLALTPRSKEAAEQSASSPAAPAPSASAKKMPEKMAASQTQERPSQQQAQGENRPHEISASTYTQDQMNRPSAALEVRPAPKPTPSPKTTASRYSGPLGQSSDSSSNESEMKKLRDELESMTNSLKGTGAEKMAAITDNNARFSPASLGGVPKGNELAGLNTAERERLDQYQRNLNSWENRLRNWQSDLNTREINTPARATAQAATAPRPEGADSSARSGKAGNGGGDTTLQLTANESSDKTKTSGKAAAASSGGPGVVDSPEAVVTSDELSRLRIDNLKKLGINYKSAFIIKIKYQQKFYDMPVKAFTYKGKDILVPLLSEQNSILSKIVLESPLFSDYKQLQLDRQKERQEFSRVIN